MMLRLSTRGDQLSKQIQDLKAEERTAAARSRELDREVHGLASGYERYKRLCFVYTAALLRAPKLSQQLQEDTKPKRGLDALIQALASRYGWPEVAFLHIDRRGAGRLGATELRMGLLLGARIDFPAVTGLTAEALLSAMDSRGAGFVTAQDLAACRPGIWQEFGATAILAMEKLRALPWEAAGGRTQDLLLRCRAKSLLTVSAAALAQGHCIARNPEHRHETQVVSMATTVALRLNAADAVPHVKKDSLISIGEEDTDAGSPLSSSENESEVSPFSRQSTFSPLKADAPIFTPNVKVVPEDQEAICKAVADAARAAATATFRPPPPQEPAPLFICSELPPPVKVYTPLPTRMLDPYLPAKKRPAFATELGLPECAECVGWEPALVRPVDLLTFGQV
ncbi:unnamed protein product [Symbiodinium natans]|uniref:Uncharacterized protein n=1 Tax=Symbiodinium natans TaxID=878477 RepID=A0A812JWU9_9DINO|nr:unnamed protein product [Symbiodinium natans]